ncbi:MAG: hypothetical protein Q9167_001978 [Letrouitia subvulpina]
MNVVDKLPLEILQIIYSFILPQDIKSTRLVSRKWHNVSSPFLMRRIFFAPRRRTLDIFNKIVKHPIFSQSITELVYDFSLFHSKHDAAFCARRNRAHYRSRRRYAFPGRSPTISSRGLRYCTTHSHASKDYNEYKRLLQEQGAITSAAKDRVSLKNALAALPKLGALFCGDWRSISGASFDRLTGSPSYDSWYVTKGPIQWDVTNACFPLTFEMMRDETGWPCPLVAWEALCYDPARFRNLDVRLGDDLTEFDKQQIMSMKILPPQSPYYPYKSLQNTKFAEDLHHFHIEAVGGERDVAPFEGDVIKSFIAAATNLRSLSLHISPGDLSILDCYWPRLQKLDLGGGHWTASSGDLMSFFQRHGDTLLHLTLGEWVIPPYDLRDWIDVLEELRILLPHLRSFSFNFLRDQTGERSGEMECNIIRQWVLGMPTSHGSLAQMLQA